MDSPQSTLRTLNFMLCLNYLPTPLPLFCDICQMFTIYGTVHSAHIWWSIGILDMMDLSYSPPKGIGYSGFKTKHPFFLIFQYCLLLLMEIIRVSCWFKGKVLSKLCHASIWNYTKSPILYSFLFSFTFPGRQLRHGCLLLENT